MQSQIRTAPPRLGLPLAVALLAALLAALIFPLLAAAQTPAPTGVYLSASSTGDRTLLALTTEGKATFALISADEAISDIYVGTWLLDPYGTVTVVLEAGANESCSGEEEVGTMTFLPSQDANVLTAVHYP